MKNLQRGFSVVEAFIVIIVLSLIGFAGWYIFDKQKNTVSPEVAAENQRLNAEAANYEAFSSEDGYQIAHLKTWSAVAAKDDNGRRITRITSPDYVDAKETKNGVTKFHDGAYIEVWAGKDEGFASIDKYLQGGQDSEGSAIKDPKKITIDGQPGVAYRLEPTNPAVPSRQIAFTRAKGIAYQMAYVDPNTFDFDKYQPDFDELVKSFNIVSTEYPQL